MKGDKVPETKTLMLDSLAENPLRSVMENSNIPWVIKDNQSRFLYINKAGIEFLDVPQGFDFEGRLDEEFPAAWSEYATEYKAHDRKAEASKDGAEIIVTSYFGRNKLLESFYCPKFPLYDSDGEVLGNIFYAKKLSFNSISQFFNNSKSSVLSLNPPEGIFTEKELDVIFYALQRIPAKEIAKRLLFSTRTIQNRLQIIYKKIGVNSLKGLIEYCNASGHSNYVPKKLLKQGVKFL